MVVIVVGVPVTLNIIAGVVVVFLMLSCLPDICTDKFSSLLMSLLLLLLFSISCCLSLLILFAIILSRYCYYHSCCHCIVSSLCSLSHVFLSLQTAAAQRDPT